MHKLWHIAFEEIRFHTGQASFWLSLLLMVGMFTAVGAFPRLQEATQNSGLADIETAFSESEVIRTPTGLIDLASIIQTIPPEQNLTRFTDETTAQQALTDGMIESYYLIPADYIETGNVVEVRLTPQLVVPQDFAMQAIIRQNLLAQADTPNLAERLEQPFIIQNEGPPIPPLSFMAVGIQIESLTAAFLVTILFTFLINMSGALLLRALQREAEANVLEMIVSSTTPSQFIVGKLLGISLIILVQGSVTLLAGLLTYGQTGTNVAELSPTFILIAIPYVLGGYVAYSGTMMCVAALWPNFAESSQLQFIVRFVAVLPIAGVLFILPDPNSTLAITLTLVPFLSPMLMPFRILLTQVAGWQLLASLLLLLAWCSGLVWLSTRLFRTQSLLTGRTPMLKAIRAAFVGR